MDCHGAKGGGKVFINDPALGVIWAPNLTRGAGGASATFTDADFVRAIRFGVAPDGRRLLVMPADDFQALSDRDFADILAYIKSLPPVNFTAPLPRLGPIGRMLYAAGQMPVPADNVRNNPIPRSTVQPAISASYGQYLARIGGCMDCHGARLSGGHLNGSPSDPPAQNLTPAGDLAHWSFAQFESTLRSGIRPDGTRINTFMPWPFIGQLTDNELKAIWLYLKRVPPRPTGNG